MIRICVLSFAVFQIIKYLYRTELNNAYNDSLEDCKNIYKPNDLNKIHYLSAKYCVPSVAEFNGNYTVPNSNIIFNSTNEQNKPLAYIVNSGVTGLKIGYDSKAWLRNVYSHGDVGNMTCTTRAFLDNQSFGNCVNYSMQCSIVPIFCL